MENEVNIIVLDSGFKPFELASENPDIPFVVEYGTCFLQEKEGDGDHGYLVTKEIISTLKNQKKPSFILVTDGDSPHQFQNLKKLNPAVINHSANFFMKIENYFSNEDNGKMMINTKNDYHNSLTHLFNDNIIFVNSSGNWHTNNLSNNSNYCFIRSDRRVLNVSRTYNQQDGDVLDKNYVETTPGSNVGISFHTDAKDLGTSLSSPTATAFVAEMKAVNPNLNYADIMQIFQILAKENKAAKPSITLDFVTYFKAEEVADHMITCANDIKNLQEVVPTGGLDQRNFQPVTYNNLLGAGTLDKQNDLQAAITLAKNWHLLEDRKGQMGESIKTEDAYYKGLKVPAGEYEAIGFPFEIEEGNALKKCISTNIAIEFSGGDFSFGNVSHISLTSPAGTKAKIMTPLTSLGYAEAMLREGVKKEELPEGKGFGDITFLTRPFANKFAVQTHKGEDLAGNWHIHLSFFKNVKVTENDNITLDFAADFDYWNNNLIKHVMTEEFTAPKNGKIALNSKGENALFFCSWTSPVTLNMNVNVNNQLNGNDFTFTQAPQHFVGHDGVDTVLGNHLNNKIHTLDGDDKIFLSSGQDKIDGGHGKDTIIWDFSKETITEARNVENFIIEVDSLGSLILFVGLGIIKHHMEEDQEIFSMGESKISFPVKDNVSLSVQCQKTGMHHFSRDEKTNLYTLSTLINQ